MTTSSKVRFPSQSQRQERGKFPIRGQSTRCPFPGRNPLRRSGTSRLSLVCSPWFVPSLVCSATKQFALSKSRTWFLFGGRRGAQSRSGGCESLDKGHRAAATRARPKRARPVVCGSGGSGLRLGIRLQQFEDQRQQRRAPPVGDALSLPLLLSDAYAPYAYPAPAYPYPSPPRRTRMRRRSTRIQSLRRPRHRSRTGLLSKLEWLLPVCTGVSGRLAARSLGAATLIAAQAVRVVDEGEDRARGTRLVSREPSGRAAEEAHGRHPYALE